MSSYAHNDSSAGEEEEGEYIAGEEVSTGHGSRISVSLLERGAMQLVCSSWVDRMGPSLYPNKDFRTARFHHPGCRCSTINALL